jgi:hypothetical protein
MNSYEVTIERVEVTIVFVEAENRKEAELLAWQKFNPVNYGLGSSDIINVKQVEDVQ